MKRILCAVLLLLTPALCAAQTMATVTAPAGKTVYAAAAQDAVVLAQIELGMQLEILSAEDGWLLVRSGGLEGYTPAGGTMPDFFAAAQPTPAPQSALSAVQATTTRDTMLFMDASLNDPLLSLPAGSVVLVHASGGTLCLVSVDGMTGYVPADSLHAGAQSAEAAQPLTAVVSNPDPADRLNLRERPDEDAPYLGKYYNGTVVTLLDGEADDGWRHVSVAGLSGYMMEKFLAPSPQAVVSAQPALRVSDIAGGLHLRAQQSADAKSLGVYPSGTPVTLMGFTGTWAHVVAGDQAGFMLLRHLENADGTPFVP